MVLPTSSILSSTNSSALQTTSAASSSSAGVSSVNSSISSAAPESATASKGCCASISSCITSVINSIRDCLSCLPLIGHWFKREAATSSTTDVSSTTAVINDAVLFDTIAGMFPLQGQQSSQSANQGPLSNDLVVIAKEQFAQISSPHVKMRAFQQVMLSTNSSDDIRKEFYGSLSVEMQNGLKTHIWDLTTGQERIDNDNGNGHNVGYGDYIVNQQISSQIVFQAVDRHIAALAPVATSSTT